MPEDAVTTDPPIRISAGPVVDGSATVAVSGEVDAHTAAELGDALEGVVRDGAQSLSLDLSDVGFIDSSGLRVLIRVHKALAEVGGGLKVVGATPTTRRLLEITGLDAHFTIE